MVNDKKLVNMNNIKRPSHYSKNGLTPVEVVVNGLFSKDETRGAFKFNILKYIVRYQDKNGIEDLYKAKEYLEMLIDYEKDI